VKIVKTFINIYGKLLPTRERNKRKLRKLAKEIQLNT